jgi:transglycosylase-like protein with SLT domain
LRERRASAGWRCAIAAVAPLLGCASAAAADKMPVLPGVASEVETVRFADPRWAPVRLLKGPAHPAMPFSPAPGATSSELLRFAAGHVAVVRGARRRVAPPPPIPAAGIETVRFPGTRLPAVSIVRGAVRDDGVGLFAAAGGELDRVAFAVDGVESGHGANAAMWRPEFDGPQGPMQVSAAAAIDVGGGDRFDLRQNRLIGRAYLAAMYRRYGNWPDAVAAYNWGPGNLDQWIAAGRPIERLPLETAHYLLRVLGDALLTAP